MSKTRGHSFRTRGESLKEICWTGLFSMGVWNALPAVEADTTVAFKSFFYIDHMQAEEISLTWHHVQCGHCGPKGLSCAVLLHCEEDWFLVQEVEAPFTLVSGCNVPSPIWQQCLGDIERHCPPGDGILPPC